MNKRNLNIFRILILWGVFLTLPLYFIPDLIQFDERGFTPIYINLFSGLLAIFIFYFHYEYNLPKVLGNKKVFLYCFWTVFTVFVAFLLLKIFIYFIGVSPSVFSLKGFKRQLGSLIPRFVLVIVAAHFIYNRVKSIKVIEQKEYAELQLLKSQIAPHFLFNTLNSLYSLALIKSDRTAKGILDLSVLMRYIVSEGQEDKVSLKTELNHLEKYISLQKIRLTDETTINFKLKGDIDSVKIAPLILIVFVENAFKYGVSTEEKTTISVDIKLVEDILFFEVENNKPALSIDQVNTEIGLTNVKNRLNLIYKEKHTLTIENNEHNYRVRLKINLK